LENRIIKTFKNENFDNKKLIQSNSSNSNIILNLSKSYFPNKAKFKLENENKNKHIYILNNKIAENSIKNNPTKVSSIFTEKSPTNEKEKKILYILNSKLDQIINLLKI